MFHPHYIKIAKHRASRHHHRNSTRLSETQLHAAMCRALDDTHHNPSRAWKGIDNNISHSYERQPATYWTRMLQICRQHVHHNAQPRQIAAPCHDFEKRGGTTDAQYDMHCNNHAVYFERQERQFCMVHAFHNLLGQQTEGLSGLNLLKFMDALAATPGNCARGAYDKHGGNFSSICLNTWLYLH